MKHVPTRTCLGCRQRRAKHELVRLVRGGDGSVVVDEGGRGTGRGAYVCADSACTERALKATRLGHAFRAACRVTDELEASVLASRRAAAGAGHDTRS